VTPPVIEDSSTFQARGSRGACMFFLTPCACEGTQHVPLIARRVAGDALP
jgi:hypothetical protein